MSGKDRRSTGQRGSDYLVGYGRPPLHSRLKKGQSCNPRGRKKGSKNVAILLHDALGERITVTERGLPRIMRKGEALVAALIAKALRGDVRAAGLVFRQLAEQEAAQRPSGPTSDPLAGLSDAELAKMIALLREEIARQEGAERDDD